MTAQTFSSSALTQPHNQTTIRQARLLIRAYLGLSVLTMVAVFLLRDHPDIAPISVWIRGTIVAVASLLMTIFAAQMARGSRAAYLRVRLISVVMLVAIVVIIALPGVFPAWMKIEQGVCGGLLFCVGILVNRPSLRSAFATK